MVRFDSPASLKGGYYARVTKDLRRRIAVAVPRDELKRLHEARAWKHFAVTGWQFLLLAAATVGLWHLRNPLFWIPLAVVQGFTIFNFTVLLHEVVHDAVFARKGRRANRRLGYLYAMPSGISATQFTRWHLDHHAELGSDTDDPKRFHLTPKINRRWYKLLYFTPALFVIYFRAAARETATYPEPLRRTITRERRATIALHLAIPAVLLWFGGLGVALRVYVLPVFFVFPVAFVLNRLGQHYDIDPDDPAKWSTLVKGSWFWNVAFLFSNFHLEHHYFPRVPCYHLPRLQKALAPFYRQEGIVPRGYAYLLWNYIVRNRKPHTAWTRKTGAGREAGARIS